MKGQRGGTAILIALGFLLFSIPLISGSLGLVQTISIDARVKTDLMHRDYCALAVHEYINYLLADTSRWEYFLANNVDSSDATKVTATVDVCGEDITLTVTQQPPNPGEDPLDPLPIIPIDSAYSQRDYQTYKTVSDSYPLAGASVKYTLTVINRAGDPVVLTEIRDTLPDGFTYDCSAPKSLLTLPGMEPQEVDPSNGPCPTEQIIKWDMPNSLVTQTGDEVTLTFTAVTSEDPGSYCNELQVVPGGDKTRSGKTAMVEINTTGGQCPGEAVVLTHNLDYADMVWSDLTTIPYTYGLKAGYTINVENTGSEVLALSGFVDLLPEGFTYFATESTGDITDAPKNLHHVSSLNRQRVTWSFKPSIPLAPGTTKTLKFTAESTNGQGVYWVDLLANFAGAFPEKVYSWPTAVIVIKDVYNVTATDADGNEYVIALQVWVQGPDGVIASWNIT